MSFTEDELQAFNSILEQRFTAHRQEMEQALDQRLNEFRQDVNQRLAALCQEVVCNLEQRVAEEKNKLGTEIIAKLDVRQAQIVEIFDQEADQRQQRIEAAIDRILAAQFLKIEQLLNQYGSLRGLEPDALAQGLQSRLEAIEVQTELPWEDLTELMGKALDVRMASLKDSLQHSVANLEQYLAVRLHSLHDEIVHSQSNRQAYGGALGGVSSIQEILEGITHLERIVESMQVAMTANHALLSNRLYHHQQLPLERAHPVGFSRAAQVDEPGSLLAQAKEHIASGQAPVLPDDSSEVEETVEQ
jgi:hypothetical protein